METRQADISDYIRRTYSSLASDSSSREGCCAGSGCCGQGRQEKREAAERLGYSATEIAGLPDQANLGLGCGNPVAAASLKEGEIVLDLGSGGGIDCFLARTFVGETGKVIGVDMTPEMIQLARKNAAKKEYDNVEFRLGEIEHLPVGDDSVDVIISNCVVNLSQDKRQVFHEINRVLKEGGRIVISDIIATADIPQEILQDPAMAAGCVAGALSAQAFREMLTQAGFSDISLKPKDSSREILKSWKTGANIEDFTASYLIEAVKPGKWV